MDISERSNIEENKKRLFLSQVETLNIFLANGAINREQYETSFNGLVTKMNISQNELRIWGLTSST